jgi:hypothetical protein
MCLASPTQALERWLDRPSRWSLVQRLVPQTAPSGAAACAERFEDPRLLQFAQDLADVRIAHARGRLSNLGDRELVGQQRIDERRDERLLGPPANQYACAS